MKFLADMGISLDTVMWLRNLGHDAVHLHEQGLDRLPDPEILIKARNEQRVLLTHDLVKGAIMPKRIVTTEKAPAAIGPYSQAIVANGFVFVSGQIPLDPKTGQIVSGDIQAQARQSLENLKAILEAAGSSMDKLVKVTVFAKDLKDFQAINQVYSEYFKENPPARSFIEVSRLPRDAAIEIEGIALLD